MVQGQIQTTEQREIKALVRDQGDLKRQDIGDPQMGEKCSHERWCVNKQDCVLGLSWVCREVREFAGQLGFAALRSAHNGYF